MEGVQQVGGSGALPVARRTGAGALVAACLLLGVLLVGLAFEPRLHELGVASFTARFNALRGLGAVGFGLSGAFLLAQPSRDCIGWLLYGIGAAFAVSMLAAGYGLVGIHDPESSLVGYRWAMWVSEWLWAPGFWLVPTLLLLIFPTGQLPSRRWWPVAAAAVLAGGLNAMGWALLPARESDVAGMYPPGYEGPVPSSSFAADLALFVGLLVGAVAVIGAVIALVQRFRRASGTERQQLEWVMLAALTTVALLGVGGVIPSPVGPLVVGVAMLPLPLAGAIAIVHHQLWDIEVVFRRSLAFGLLTTASIATYGVTVWVLGGVLGARTGAPLIAVALVAIGMAPAYQRIGRWVNQVVYGARDDPSETLARLGSRLQGAVDPGEVLSGVTATIAAAMRVPYVAVEAAGLEPTVTGVPVPDRLTLPLRHLDVEVGTLVIGVARADRMRPGDRAAVEALAPHLAVVVHAHRLAGELERSNARLLAARVEERQRLQRELHDGLGPTLASLALEIDRGRLLAPADPGSADRLLEVLSDRIRETVGVVRAIVDDLPPPPLDALGLDGAVAALAARLDGEMRVTVSVATLPPIPAPVELAAYRIAAEAMTNASRHARATCCRVELSVEADRLVLSVEDDGCGLAAAVHERIGLASMRRRAADLLGNLEVVARTDGGTRVLASLPLTDRQAGDY
jgi:signal transduction histidine kinase